MDTTGRKVWIVLHGFIFDKHNFTKVGECRGFVTHRNFNRGEVAAFKTKEEAEFWVANGTDHLLSAWQTAVIEVYAREVGL